jgi:hypothetical protein
MVSASVLWSSEFEKILQICGQKLYEWLWCMIFGMVLVGTSPCIAK